MPESKRTPPNWKGRRRRRTPGARSRPGSEAGFTLIEVLIGAAILITGLAALFSMLDTSVKATYQTRAREGATNLARQVLEDAQTLPFAQISPTSIEGQLQEMNALADGSGSPGWQIVQRGITYTVTVSECSIDDPKDGSGVHDSTFCKDAGEAVGLSATSLQLSSPKVAAPTAPVIITEPKTLVFTATAPSGTTAMAWSLDGVKRTPAPTLEKGTTWTFSWSIVGISDGAYKVTVQAINSSGVVGPPITITVTLIRNIPAAPKVTAGGFNTVNVAGTAKKVVELEWQANSERNIIGYRAYNPSKELVCPATASILSLSLSCIDFNPPSTTAANLTYTVVALYRKAEGETLSETVSESPAGSFKVTGGEPPPAGPNVPGSPLTLVRNADGTVTLKWSAPTGGTAVSFYRIYRDGTNYDDRYDFTANASTTTYTDDDAVGERSYWVTAVSSTLTESPFLGPVKG